MLSGSVERLVGRYGYGAKCDVACARILPFPLNYWASFEGISMIGVKTGLLASILVGAGLLLSACDSGTGGAPAGSAAPAPASIDPQAGGERAATPRTNAIPEPAKPVIAETLPYAEVDEQLVYGHFAFPDDMIEPLPGVIVIHERWGLDDGVRALANRIAGEGYIVLAIDLYGGETAENTDAARQLMVEVVENPELANQNIQQAYDFLLSSSTSPLGAGSPPRIAALGWSFGGGWALNAAMLLPDDLDAAVIYYGQVTDDEERLAPVNAPILGLFGANDRGVSRDSVVAFEKALQNLEKDYEIEIYDNAGHAFADPQASNYQPDVAAEAWEKVVVFLGENLR